MENTTDGDYLYGGPSTSAMFNFLADRKFPTKHTSLLFGFGSQEQEKEIVADLAEKKPKYYIFDDFSPMAAFLKGPSEFGRTVWWDKHVLLVEYLRANYDLERKIGRFYLYRLRTCEEKS